MQSMWLNAQTTVWWHAVFPELFNDPRKKVSRPVVGVSGLLLFHSAIRGSLEAAADKADAVICNWCN